MGRIWFAVGVTPTYARALGRFPDQALAQRAADAFVHPGCDGAGACSDWRRVTVERDS